MSPQIVPLTSAHTTDLMRLIRALSAFHGEEATPAATTLVDDLDSGLSWGFGAGSPLFAYALASIRPVNHRGSRDVSLDHVFVAAEYRRRGLATALVAAIEEEGRRRGCNRMVIGAHLQNSVARDTYEAFRCLVGGLASQSGRRG